MYHAKNDAQKPITSILKIMIQTKNLHISTTCQWDVNNFYGWAISKTLAIDGFKWKKYLLRFDEGLLQNYDQDTDKGCILEIDVKFPKELQKLRSDLPFLPRK